MKGNPNERTWIVVPCYNEADRLNVAEFKAYLALRQDVGFVFVNDGSTDGTLIMLRDLECGGNGRVAIIDQQPNQGKAEAVRVGMLQAFQYGSDYAGYFDADLATPLSAIELFTAVLDNNSAVDFVLGARVALLGRNIARKPVRHYLGRAFATAASMVLGLSVYDTQCGAKLLRCDVTLRQVFEKPFGSRWIFDVELIARYLQRPGAHSGLYELPLPQWTDVGESRVKPIDFLRSIGEMATIYRCYRLPGNVSTLLRILSAPFIRYAGAGGVGTAIHYLVLTLIVEACSVSPAWASVAGALAGAIVNYFINYHLTFASKRPHRETLPRFFAIAALGATLNGIGMCVFTQRLTMHYLVAQCLCTVVVLLVGFVLNKVWTFKAANKNELGS